MPKKIDVLIKEDLTTLEKLFSSTKSPLKRDRIQTLLFIKKGKYTYQSDIGKKLRRMEKTIRTWIQEYEKHGLSALLQVKSGGNNTRTLSRKILLLIEKEFTNPESTITSYLELKEVLEKETGETIAYGALYSHCRRKYKSKLKVTRKSYYMKDSNAEAF